MADMKHFNSLSFFVNAVDHAIDRMRPSAVKNMPKLARLTRGRPDVGLIFEAKDRSL
jgi:hypothetical protein